MKLEVLKPASGSVRNNVRLGRGQGSGGGGTAKRGHKGAKSRSGYSSKRGFEGGQMPLQRRVPKFGFKNINRIEYKAINLDAIQALIDSTNTSSIDLGFLYNHGLISKSDKVKVLGRGEIKSAVEVKVHAFSKSAIEAIEKAGGKTIVDGKLDTETVVVVEKPKKVAKVVEAAPVVNTAPVVEATPVVEAAPVVESTPASVGADDLKKIEGIGPKIAELLIADGITTFAALSTSTVEHLSEILAAAGSRYATHNPATWPEQAVLAAEGKWDELKDLQDRLNGGRPE